MDEKQHTTNTILTMTAGKLGETSFRIKENGPS